ncbi:protein of unknown function [Hyphomicrobium sp. MC1]|nr:protein of unknown function [Hyphomicrobium sp. MC1]
MLVMSASKNRPLDVLTSAAGVPDMSRLGILLETAQIVRAAVSKSPFMRPPRAVSSAPSGSRTRLHQFFSKPLAFGASGF